jgi:Glycosyl transferase family group 2
MTTSAMAGWALSLLFVPLAWLVVDAIGGLRARHSAAVAVGTHEFHDFAVLVPIYGNIKYLENVEYLARYGQRVVLCTTTGESPAFNEALVNISRRYGFRIFRATADNSSTAGGKRATGGTVRDTVIKAVLPTIDARYVVCIDADTTTTRPLERLVGALHSRGLDVASIRLVPSNEHESLLTRFQAHEYRLAMQLRIIAPWLLSGACHAARTSALRQIMDNHSLFFQGNDVEAGVLADAMGFRVGHVPFEVPTAVPNTVKAWWRQHVAWAGGEFRLFVVNARIGVRHPFFWCYGLVVTLAMLPLRLIALVEGQLNGIGILVGLYVALGLYLHWSRRDFALLLMPLYAGFISLLIVPLGVVSYISMARGGRNAGVIRVPRMQYCLPGSEGRHEATSPVETRHAAMASALR